MVWLSPSSPHVLASSPITAVGAIMITSQGEGHHHQLIGLNEASLTISADVVSRRPLTDAFADHEL